MICTLHSTLESTETAYKYCTKLHVGALKIQKFLTGEGEPHHLRPLAQVCPHA